MLGARDSAGGRRPLTVPRPEARDVRHSRSAAADAAAWHTLDGATTLERLGTSDRGLSSEDAATRRAQYGPNRLRVTPPVPAWKILLAQFRGLIVVLLAAATVVAVVTGDRADALAIAVVLALNAALGFTTELRARRAMEALRSLESPTATVVRDGVPREITADGLVPGDVIVLEAGRSVPADARLIEVAELRAVEASLTGESMPVSKRATVTLDAATVLGERVNLVFQGTSVVAGAGRAVVVATGDATEVGQIGVMTTALGEEPTPLERRLDALGRRLVWVALGVAGVVAGLSLARGAPWNEVFALGVALAVAAVPEGLPVVATVALAIGVSRLARRRTLVRRLPAVETLGSVTIVCTDKTGTLTAGEMTVTTLVLGNREFHVIGTGYGPEGAFMGDDDRLVSARELPRLRDALGVGALANRADVVRDNGHWRAVGDPTEAALLVAATKAGMDRAALRASLPEVAQVPFSSERKWMATFHRAPAGLMACAKGAPDRIIARCARELAPDDTERALDEAARARLHDWNERLAEHGLRVLALARGVVDHAEEDAVRDLTFLGLVGIADPPAAGVHETVEALGEAGIRTVMVTGDQRLTAVAVARELGLVRGAARVLDAQELEALDDQALLERMRDVNVLCRVSPADKLRIVSALQQRGDIIAMLGDGVNDAAALRKADIGVAMGVRGTDVAKDAADMVLADDRFATIGAAVEEGRVVFDNIRKFVFYLFSCNLAEVAVLFGAGVAGTPAILTPLQILWLNLVTDTFPALALAVEPAEPGVMRRRPRDPQEAILSASFLRGVAFYALLIGGVTLAAFLLIGARDAGAGRTAAFMTLALSQALHLGNARSRSAVVSPARAIANRWALGAVLLVIGLQVVVVVVPGLRTTLGLAPLGIEAWLGIFVLSLVPATVGQVLKLAMRGRPD